MHQRLLEPTWCLYGLALLGGIACQPPSDSSGVLGKLESPVVNGYLADDNPTVVYLPGCTGTLIASNLVLTALHCVAPIVGDDSFSCEADGTLANPPNGQLGEHYSPERVTISLGVDFTNHVDAYAETIVSTQSTQICQNDLAFVILDRHLSGPISPVRIDQPVSPGQLVDVVGYGLTSNPNNLPPDEVVARRRRDAVKVLAVGSTADSPQGGDALPRTFAVGESVCKGDSGGPAFAEDGSVLGVYSTLIGGCTGAGARNFYTMLSEFGPLVLSAYSAAGATPWLSGQIAPGRVTHETADSGGGATTADSTRPAEASSSRAIGTGYCSMASGAPPPQDRKHQAFSLLVWLALARPLRRRAQSGRG